MNINQIKSNDNIDNTNTKLIPYCIGKGCKNIGKHYLKIVLINKSAWLCDSCKDDFLQMKLIE
ncbi:MAG: hypothetical protein AB7V56_06435 [Candidatus Nitrosocosmicus sp.]